MLISLANRFFNCMFPLKDYFAWHRLRLRRGSQNSVWFRNQRKEQVTMKTSTKSSRFKYAPVKKLGRRAAVLKGLRRGIDPLPVLHLHVSGKRNTGEIIVGNTDKLGKRFNKGLLSAFSDRTSRSEVNDLLKKEITFRNARPVVTSSKAMRPVLLGPEKNVQIDMSDSVGKRLVATTEQ